MIFINSALLQLETSDFDAETLTLRVNEARYQERLAGVYGHEQRHVKNMIDFVTFLSWQLQVELEMEDCHDYERGDTLAALNAALRCIDRKNAIESSIMRQVSEYVIQEMTHTSEYSPVPGYPYDPIGDVPPPLLNGE